MKLWVTLGMLLAASAVGTASMLESALMPRCQAALGALAEEACSLQYDGGQHGDAPDRCGIPAPRLDVGKATTGLLVPFDDPADFYDLFVSPQLVGRFVEVRVAPGLMADAGLPVSLASYDVIVLQPDCRQPADLFGSGDRYGFFVRSAGVYHVGITMRLGLMVGLDGEGGYGTDVCHAFCWGSVVNPAAGYSVSSGSF